MGTDIKGKWYSLGFTMENSRMVYASRKGTVVKVIDNVKNPEINAKKYCTENNLIQILHQDGTIAEYTNFASKCIFKQIGDVVYPGDRLGEIDTHILPVPFVGLTVFHADIQSKYYKTIIPKFYTSKGIIKVHAPETYISEQTNKIIGFEMTRKEKKKFLK